MASIGINLEEELSQRGVLFFEPKAGLNINANYLTLPEEITEAAPTELGEHLNAFTQQKMYLRTLCGRIEALIDSAKSDYSFAAEKFYLELCGQKLSETAKEKLINANAEVKPILKRLQELRTKQNLLQKNIESIEDAIFLISREVTRRNADFNNENRNHNLK